MALVLVIAGLGAASCGPPFRGSPPGHDVEIVVDGNVLWAQNVGLDSYAWDGKPTDLMPIPNFTLEQHTIGVRFRDVQEQTAVFFPNHPGCRASVAGAVCPPFVLRRRPELHLFERNPRNVYFTLLSDPFGNPWKSNLATPTVSGINQPPFELPADVVIPYGNDFTLGDPYPSQISVGAFGEQDFLRRQDPISGTGGTPTLLSQWQQPSAGGVPKALTSTHIEAARLLTLPECSAKVNIQNDLFARFAGMLSGLRCDGMDFSVSATAASYVTHADPDETNLWSAQIDSIYPWNGVFGGIMVDGWLQMNSTSGLEACAVYFKYDLRYALDGGIFTLKPIRLQLEPTSGFQCQHDSVFLGWIPTATQKVQELFETQLPNIVRGSAAAQQAIPASTPQKPLVDTAFRCTYPMIQGEGVADVDECRDAMQKFQLGITSGSNAGAAQLGIDSTGVLAAINDPTNWRCRPPTDFEIAQDCSTDPSQTRVTGRCQFVIPASDVIAEPDEARIVWPPLNDLVDGSPQVSASSAAFVLAFTQGPTAYQQLCNPSPEVSGSAPFYQRYFATFTATQHCDPTPAPSPPPPLVCPCTTSSQCLNGDVCTSIAGVQQCEWLCVNDNDCTGRLGGIFRCVNDLCGTH